MKQILLPIDENQVRSLRAGDAISISGLIHTGRDKFHKFFADGGKIGVDFNGGALYHCGPVVIKENGIWQVKAAGPTTSVRENPYESAFIEKSGVRLIIGKGGMDDKTHDAMKRFGCVYVQAVGGAAALAAQAVKSVDGVDFLEEFGAAEACWHFNVEDFTGIVAMDSLGNSLFKAVADYSSKRLLELLG